MRGDLMSESGLLTCDLISVQIQSVRWLSGHLPGITFVVLLHTPTNQPTNR